MRRLLALGTVLGALAMSGVPASAENQGLPPAPLDQRNFAHRNNVPSLGGNNIDFFERREADGTIRRFLVAATQGNGLDIVEITDLANPVTVGRYIGPDTDTNKVRNYGYGNNSHAWVSVNPVRKIVALTVEEQPTPSVTTRHGNGLNGGIQFVDISDVANPRPLGKIDDLDSPHTVRMIGNNHAYTSLNTYIVNYTDPMNPCIEDQVRNQCDADQELASPQGHEFWEDPNIPGRGYIGLASSVSFKWGTADLSNPARPVLTDDDSRLNVPAGYTSPATLIGVAHEAYPSPDSSLVGVADFRGGQTTTGCPGGGAHFFDIAGKHSPSGTLGDPAWVGSYFVPFGGVGTSGFVNYGSCTMHSWQSQTERMIGVSGMYQGGTYVFDYSHPTQPGGAYTEWDGSATGRGKTTWGNTVGHNRDALDYVNAAQWLPFDLADPADERLVFTNGSVRGLDVYDYTQPLPKKMSRLNVNGSAAGGAVTGKLDRYAVLTYQGWVNKPLAGQTLDVTAGGTTVQVTTAADGSFSANLGLGAGAHQVTVAWAGDDRFAPNSVTRIVNG